MYDPECVRLLGVLFLWCPVVNFCCRSQRARAHPTYAGTHSAKSSAVAYSRLTNPRRGPTGSAEETDACFIVWDHNRQALAYVYLQIAGIVGGALDRRRPRASLRVSPLL